MTPKIIIVGSGIGGSGIGALLATSTKANIELFERDKILGGRCASYEKRMRRGARGSLISAATSFRPVIRVRSGRSSSAVANL